MSDRTMPPVPPLQRVRVRAHKGPLRQRMRERMRQVRDVGERSAPFFLALASFIVSGVGMLSFFTEGKRILHTHGQYHSWFHLLAFAVIGYVLVRAGRSDRQRRWFFIAAMILGFATEVGEHLVYHSRMEWKDVFMDVTGAVGGTLAALATLIEIKRQLESEARRAAA